jgi:hypothetical protein
MNNPNTRIIYGKLTQSDLEKFVQTYKEVGLFVTAPLPSINSINEDNLNLREFEITPSPSPGEANNKLLIGIKYHKNGNLYVETQIHPGEENIKNPEELKNKYNKLIREYFLREK